MKLIPFKWLPGSWGLKGKAFERAEAEYLYEGEVLERHLLDIDYDPGSPEHAAAKAQIDFAYGYCNEYDRDLALLAASPTDSAAKSSAMIELGFKHGMITEYDRDVAYASLIEDEVERKIELLVIDARYGVIEQFKADKEIATLQNKSWVGGPSGCDEDGEFRFELEWNDQWIAELREAGYEGGTDELVMKKWFADICYNEVISANPEGVDPLVYDTARESLRRSIKD